MSFSAVNNRVLVRLIDSEFFPSVTKPGIGKAGAISMYGQVVSVGDGADIDVEEGDNVYFNAAEASVVSDDLISVDELDVLSVRDDDATVGTFDVDEARGDIYEQIEAEREYQDELWGGAENDDKKSEFSWTSNIIEYASGTGRAASHAFRARMIKVAALALAAVESVDRKEKANDDCG